MKPKLYVIPISHPAFAAQLMLERKGIEHERISLLSGFHPLGLRLAGFRGKTVPALRVGERRVQGTLAISRALDELWPDAPPLFPADPERRRQVEEAERWGEGELQDVPRRLFRWALVRCPALRRSLVDLNRLPFRRLATAGMKPIAAHFARASGADDARTRADLAGLPALLDRIDGWLEAGLLGSSEPNAADLQIAPSVRLLSTFDDLQPAIDRRPAGRFARRLLPEYPGRVPPVFPAAWLEALDAPAAPPRADVPAQR